MKDLSNKVFCGFLQLCIGLAVLLFFPAWTFDYWQAWIFLAVYSLSVLAVTLCLMKRNPELLERRINANPGSEKRRNQKILNFLISKALFLVVVVSVIDHRCAWSAVPLYGVAAGDVLVALGFLIGFLFSKKTLLPRPSSKSEPGRKSYRQDLTRWCVIRCILVGWSRFQACRPPSVRGGDCSRLFRLCW